MGFENIILIGMPASGKSTVGVILAKVLGMDFIDTDIVIQQREGARLNEIIESQGIDDFLKCEERAILGMDVKNTVVATGGSAVYSDVAMKHLEDGSKVVYLKVSLDDLKSRLTDMKDYAEMYQHLGCELYNSVTADNGVTRYSLCYHR